MKSDRSNVTVSIVALMVAALLFGLLAWQFNKTADPANEQPTNSEEAQTEPELKSEMLLLRQGEQKTSTELNISVALEGVNLAPCENQAVVNNNPDTNTEAPTEDSCQMRNGQLSFVLAKLPTEPGVAPEQPERVVVSTVPGIQTSREYVVQVIEFKDNTARVVIRKK